MKANKAEIYIYRFYCKVNRRSYVGRTSSPQIREVAHRSNLKKGTHRSARMQQDHDRYGSEAFRFHVLERVANPLVASDRETYWATRYRCFSEGYNSYRPVFDVVSQGRFAAETVLRWPHGNTTTFSRLLRSRREELGLTQLAVARGLGLKSGEHIGLVESAQRYLDLNKVPTLARILRCNVKEVAQLALAEQYPLLYAELFGRFSKRRPA